MAGWYVRRGEKVMGPIESAQLKQGYATGKLLPTDEIAKDPAGPWTEVRKTSIAKQEEPAKPQVPAVIQPAKPAVPAVIQTEPELPSAPKGFKGVLVSTWASITRTISVRSQRKHELKLAKMQALAAQNPASQRVSQVTGAQPAIQTVVNVTNVNKNINKGGCAGCGGCGTLVLLVVITLIIIAVVAQLQTPAP